MRRSVTLRVLASRAASLLSFTPPLIAAAPELGQTAAPPRARVIPARGTSGEAFASMLLSRPILGQHFAAFVRAPSCSTLNSIALKI